MRKRQLILLCITVISLHAICLFLVIPKLSGRLTASYNQDLFTDGYDYLAQNLVSGNGYRFYPETAETLMREPGFPLYLAGLRIAFGSSVTVVKLANLLMALATAWMIALYFRRIAPGLRMQESSLLVLAPSMLFLLHPGTILAESRGGVEIPFAMLLMLYCVAVDRAVETNRWREYMLSGFVLGVTVSVRSTPMLFPCALLCYLLLVRRPVISASTLIRNIAVMVGAMFAVLAPWTVRNYSLTGKVVPTASVLGVSAQAGQYINEHLFEGRPFWLLDREASRKRDRIAEQLGFPFEDGQEGYYQTFYKTEDEIKFSTYLLSQVISRYRQSPVLFARCIAQNAVNFWVAGKTWAATAANAAIQLPYLILAAAGAMSGLRTSMSRRVGMVVLLIAYVEAVHLPILAQARYSVPLIPFVSLLAAIGLVAVWARVNESRALATTLLRAEVQGSHPPALTLR